MRLRSYIIREELNGANALRFAEQLSTSSFQGVDGIELSLGRATEVDVVGLAVLVRIYSQLVARGRTLVVCDVPSHVLGQFRRLGIEHMVARPAPLARRPRPRPLRAFAQRVRAVA